MKVLFIGGTGIISTASTRLAVEQGIDLTLLRRGRRIADLPKDIRTITADMADEAAVAEALGGSTFDAVVDWIAFTPADIERDIRLFRGRTKQYIFISSASAYQKPVGHYLITESTPLANPYWQYSRNKIACEERADEGLPRRGLSHHHRAPFADLWRDADHAGREQLGRNRTRRWTVCAAGKKVIVPGDGSSLWVITHNSDFAKGLVGLLGHPQAIGNAFHITSDEVMSWDQFYTHHGEAAGVEAQLMHIPSDFLAACMPEEMGSLTGDKSVSVVFDNSKIKRFVPGVLRARFRLPKVLKGQSIGSTPTRGESRSTKRRTPPGTS